MEEKVWERPNYEGTWYQMLFRRAAGCISKPLSKTKVTPNQVTTVATMLYVVPAVLLLMNNVWLNIAAIPVVYFINILDKVDGQLARMKKMTSKRGCFIDGILHNVADVAFYLPLGISQYVWQGNFAALAAAAACVIFILMSRYNYLNRAYLVGSESGNETDKLKVRRFSGLDVIKKLYSIPNQHLPEITSIALVAGLVPWMLYAYAVYQGFSLCVYTIMLSRFDEKCAE